MPRWPWTGNAPKDASPALETPSAELAVEVAVAPKSIAPDSATPTEPAIARQVEPVAPAPPQAPADPRGPERGGELERSLAANHDGGISSMSLVGAQGGLHQTAWVFAEASRMADTNESDAIAQRIVDSTAIPLSFEPQSFYESLASLTSYREQGGFDGGEGASSSSAFSSLSDATNTYPPFGSPQTRGAGTDSPSFDAQPAQRTVERAVSAQFSSQSALPPASSGLVFENGVFSAPEPPSRPQQQRALGRWATDRPPSAPPAPSTATPQPTVQRLADHGEPPSPGQPPFGGPESARPTPPGSTMASSPAELSLATPTAPVVAAGSQLGSGADTPSAAPLQRSPETTVAAQTTPATPPMEIQSAEPPPRGDSAERPPAASVGDPAPYIQDIARTVADSPPPATADSPDMPLAVAPQLATQPAYGSDESAGDDNPVTSPPGTPLSSSSAPATAVQRVPDAAATGSSPLPPSAPAQAATGPSPAPAADPSRAAVPLQPPASAQSTPVSPSVPSTAPDPVSDLPLAPAGAVGQSSDIISRRVATDGALRETRTQTTAPADGVDRPAPTAQDVTANAGPASTGPSPALVVTAAEANSTVDPNGATAESESPAPSATPASVLRTFAEMPSPLERDPLEMTLAEGSTASASAAPLDAAGGAESKVVSPAGSPSPAFEAALDTSNATSAIGAAPPPVAHTAAGADVSIARTVAPTVADTSGVPTFAPTSAETATARTSATAAPHPPRPAEPELTLHQVAVAPGSSAPPIRRRFDPLRFLRRSPAPESVATPADAQLPSAQPAPVAAQQARPAPPAISSSPAAVSPTLVSRSMGAASDPPEMNLLATGLESPNDLTGASGPETAAASALAAHPSAESASGGSVEMPLALGTLVPQSPLPSTGDSPSSLSAASEIARSVFPTVTVAAVGEPAASPQAARTAAAAAAGQAAAPTADLTLQRSPAALSVPASIDRESQPTQRAAPPPSPATPAGTASQASGLPLQRSGSSRPVSSHQPLSPGTAGAPTASVSTAPQANAPAATIARGEAAHAGYANLDLVAPPAVTDASTTGSALSAPAASSAQIVPLTLDLASPASNAPTARLDRSLDTPQRPGSPAAESALPIPAVPIQSGPTPVTNPPSLDLAVSPSALTTRSSAAAPGDVVDTVLQRAAAAGAAASPLGQSNVAAGPTALTAMANSGGATLASDPPRLDLASPVPGPGVADLSSPAAERSGSAARTGSSASPSGRQTSSPAAAIARALATPAPSGPLADLPLSAAVSLAAISRTSEGASGFDLAAPEAGRRNAGLSRTVAPMQLSAAPTNSAAALSQPLVTPPSSRVAEFDSSPAAGQLYVARPEPQPTRSLQRSPDMPLSIEPSTEGAQRSPAVEAFGAITSIQRDDDPPSEGAHLTEENLEQITEHVWQFVRKELRVERERQRGQA